MDSTSAVVRAAVLVNKACSPRLKPTDDIEYRELLHEYSTDGTFRRTVLDVAAGFRLQVLDVSVRFGMIVIPHIGTELAMSTADYRQRLNIKDKGILALALVATASTFFPTAASLDVLEKRSDVTATITQITNHLRRLAEDLQKQHADDPESLPDGLEPSWRAILQKPVIKESPDTDRPGRRSGLNSLRGLVTTVVNSFVEFGLLREEKATPESFYLPTHRLKAQLATLAGEELYRVASKLTANAVGSDAKGTDDATN